MTPEIAPMLVTALAESPPDSDATADRILDAALDELAAHGVRGATIDEVAARAGVGRVTVFRRFGSKDALIQRLVVREVHRFIATVDAAIAPYTDPADRVAEAFVACVRTSVEHPMVARLARDEPGAALERLGAGNPSPLELARAYVASRIRADVPEPNANASADELADVLTRLATMYVLVPSAAVDLGDEDSARDFAKRVLAPVLG